MLHGVPPYGAGPLYFDLDLTMRCSSPSPITIHLFLTCLDASGQLPTVPQYEGSLAFPVSTTNDFRVVTFKDWRECTTEHKAIPSPFFPMLGSSSQIVQFSLQTSALLAPGSSVDVLGGCFVFRLQP